MMSERRFGTTRASYPTWLTRKGIPFFPHKLQPVRRIADTGIKIVVWIFLQDITAIPVQNL
jgi:hypothetical protein